MNDFIREMMGQLIIEARSDFVDLPVTYEEAEFIQSMAEKYTDILLNGLEINKLKNELADKNEWIKMQDKLLVCYRMGRSPSMKTLDTLAKFRDKYNTIGESK